MNGIIIGFFLLFLRTELSIVNESFLYFLSNILGTLLLYSNATHLFRLKPNVKNHLLVYGFLNSTLLLLRLLGVELIGISLSSVGSTLLSLSMLLFYILIFVYPLYLLTLVLSSLEDYISRERYELITGALKVAALIMSLAIVLFYFPALSSLGVLVVLLLQFSIISLLAFGSKEQVFSNK